MGMDDLVEKPRHPLDAVLNEIQQRAYTTREKDGILARSPGLLSTPGLSHA